MIKKIVQTGLGLAVVLAWWTLTGDRVTTSPAQDKIPASVWGGGGGALAIEAETTSRAQMRVSFSRDHEGEQLDSLETYEDVAAGAHSWSIDVPKDAGGYVELGAVDPKPGDRLKIRVLLNGDVVFEDEDQLEKPLEPGYAFFVQAYFDDYATAALPED